MLDTSQSQKCFEKSKSLAPGGVHSPVRAFQSVGGSPLFFKSGKGSKITDEDNNEYVDFCMSWGALAVGHAHPKVVEQIQMQVSNGTHFGTPTRQSMVLAELALSFIKPHEKIRFVNSGTEAVMTAIRLARGTSKKNKIIKIQGAYHGHLDSMLVSAGSGLVTQGQSSSDGVPPGQVEDTLIVPFNQKEALDKAFQDYQNQVAAIIVEPVLANNGLFEFSKDYLSYLREICDKNDSLLIFDEVITGFRVHSGGAMALYNIKPDISTYGKILGGGMPVGAVAASAKIMDGLAPTGKVYQAGTLSGNPVTMAAGIASLQCLRDEKYYEHINKIGSYLDKQMAQIKEQTTFPFYYKRLGAIFWICPGTDEEITSPEDIPKIATELYAQSYHKILEKGVYLSPSVFEVAFLSLAHSEADIDKLINALKSL